MKPTKLMTKMAAKMSNAELAQSIATTYEEMKKGGGETVVQTRWAMMAALKSEASKPSRKW